MHLVAWRKAYAIWAGCDEYLERLLKKALSDAHVKGAAHGCIFPHTCVERVPPNWDQDAYAK
jgi:hypothetical protein